MRRNPRVLGGLILLLVVMLGTAGVLARGSGDRDGEQALGLDQLPAAARATIVQAAGQHRLTELEAEVHHGVTVYDAEWQADGREVEISVLADGTVVPDDEDGDHEAGEPDD